MKSNKGRPLKEKNEKFKHYELKFKAYVKQSFPLDPQSHYEDSDINQFPGNSRYTKEYLCSLKMTRDFGNKCVDKYKAEFIDYLKDTFGSKSYKEYLENRNEQEIKLNYPDDTRYTDEYLKCNELNNQRVRLTRLKKCILAQQTKFASLKKYVFCHEHGHIFKIGLDQCTSESKVN